MSGVQILENELEKSRDRLKEFNENIKKLTGYENPGQRGRRNFRPDSQDYDDNFSGRMGRGRGRIFGIAKRGLMEDSGPPVKRRIVGGAFSRLGPPPLQRKVREDSPEEEDLPTGLSVHSSVVSTSREAKNRQDIMQEQTKDKEGMQRNRRMFGLLLGTLNKFKTDSKTMESKEEQRKRIDQKLEENAEKEKKKFKQETMQLMEERHLEETRISRLEQKMEVVQEHADIETEMKKLKHFLCTKSRPRIFWKPRQMNAAAENKLKDTSKVVDEMLRASQDRLEKEIKDVMEREQKREERIKMRLREDGLFLDEDNKEKENSANDKVLPNVEEKAVDNASKSLEEKDESTAKQSDKKMKNKRRVVVEEHTDEDNSIQSEDSGDEVEKSSKKSNKSEEKKKVQKADKKGNEDESGSNSDNDSKRNKESISQPHGKKRDEKSSKEKSDENRTDDEENSRVVMYRERSKEKKKSGKDKKRDNDDEKNEHKSHSDKHSHRHSKHRKRHDEKVVIKEEREDKHEKEKSKTSDRVVVEEEEESDVKSSKSKKNVMNLIGEEEDVEMESETNITM